MPYTKKQERFFSMCEHNPGAAYKKCPPKGTSRKLAHEAHQLRSKKSKM